jgi:hypothetical protein
MTRTTLFRQILRIVAMALALSAIAGPASARTFDFNSHGSLIQQPTPATAPRGDSASSASGVDWGYIAIGTTTAALALIGIGAVTSGRRHSHKDRPQRATITG